MNRIYSYSSDEPLEEVEKEQERSLSGEHALLRWNKLCKTLGISSQQTVKYEFLRLSNPKAFSKHFGDTGSFNHLEEVQVPWNFRPSQIGKNGEIRKGHLEPVHSGQDLRFSKLRFSMGMSDAEAVNYDYIQSINPKVFDRVFGERPGPHDLNAPPNFRPRIRRFKHYTPKISGSDL